MANITFKPENSLFPQDVTVSYNSSLGLIGLKKGENILADSYIPALLQSPDFAKDVNRGALEITEYEQLEPTQPVVLNTPYISSTSLNEQERVLRVDFVEVTGSKDYTVELKKLVTIEELPTDKNFYEFALSDSGLYQVTVKANGNTEMFIDSAISESQLIKVELKEPEKIEAPVVESFTYNDDEGLLVSLFSVNELYGIYHYQVEKDGVEYSTGSAELAEKTIAITESGLYGIKVKATPKDTTKYIESDYSKESTVDVLIETEEEEDTEELSVESDDNDLDDLLVDEEEDEEEL